MGAQHKRKMQSTVLLVSLAVIFANASPISDSVVLEDTDFAMDTDLSEARATINDMIADGASDADCRKLTGTPSTTSRVPSRSCRRRSILSAPALNATPRARHKSRLLLRPRPRPTPPSPPPRKNCRRPPRPRSTSFPCVQHTHCWQVRHLL